MCVDIRGIYSNYINVGDMSQLCTFIIIIILSVLIRPVCTFIYTPDTLIIRRVRNVIFLFSLMEETQKESEMFIC